MKILRGSWDWTKIGLDSLSSMNAMSLARGVIFGPHCFTSATYEQTFQMQDGYVKVQPICKTYSFCQGGFDRNSESVCSAGNHSLLENFGPWDLRASCTQKQSLHRCCLPRTLDLPYQAPIGLHRREAERTWKRHCVHANKKYGQVCLCSSQ